MTSLEIKHLNISFDDRKVISNLSLSIDSGNIASLLGPSGCGKTTLLRAIAGLVQPDSGTIRLGTQLIGVSSVLLPAEKRNIGYVPQNSALFPHLTVERNIAFGLKRDLYSKSEIESIVSEMLELIGLSDFAKRMPTELSGGQQTRVALARALAIKPKLVLLDEPFSALDAQLRNELRNEVVALLRKQKATAILVTHDREEALVSSDQIVLMRDGRVIQTGTPEEVYESPISSEVAMSIGDALIIEANSEPNGSIISMLSGQTDISDKSMGYLIVRPEEIKVSKRSIGSGPSGVIRKIEYYGHDAMLQIELAKGKRISARTPAPLDFVVGEEVWLDHQGPIRYFSNQQTVPGPGKISKK